MTPEQKQALGVDPDAERAFATFEQKVSDIYEKITDVAESVNLIKAFYTGDFENVIDVIEKVKGLADLGSTVNDLASNVSTFFNSANEGLSPDIESLLDSYASKVFGNVDLNNRQVLTWTQDKINEFKDALASHGIENPGGISTVLGGSDTFWHQDTIPFTVAYTPMLATESGPVLLNWRTVEEYIYALFDEAFADGNFSVDKVLELDKRGFDNDWDDTVDHISGLVAGIAQGESVPSVNLIGEIMHLSETDENEEAINKILNLIGLSIEDFDFPSATIVADREALIESIRSALASESFTVGVKGGSSFAFAQGTVENGALTHDVDAVTGETGTEGLIRDGKLTEIPSGAHVEHLKKGDVILNSRQMKQLKNGQKASGKGKIIGGESALPAFSHGTCGDDDDEILAFSAGTGIELQRKNGKIYITETGTALDDLSSTMKALLDVTKQLDPVKTFSKLDIFAQSKLMPTPWTAPPKDERLDTFEARQNRGAKELFDLYDTKIENNTEAINRLADMYSEYMSVTERNANLTRRQNLLLEQIET